MTQPIFSSSIEPVWALVRGIRGRLCEVLACYPEELRAAAVMTASELLENAIKYGESVPGAPQIGISLSVVDGHLRIETVNGSRNLETVNRLKTHVEQVKHADDKMSLWIDRVQAFSMRPSEDSGLGLYRVTVEGGFDLSCSYQDCVVVVIATRRVT